MKQLYSMQTDSLKKIFELLVLAYDTAEMACLCADVLAEIVPKIDETLCCTTLQEVGGFKELVDSIELLLKNISSEIENRELSAN